ncbi:16S rRNA (cytosine(1402)-N(4))-methyltransferase RsmH [Chlamydiifrater volucris]|uniref:16S rRNA (cytosine(1402)-N(4))-methyltransferase RsmH n=1 Tax=Chlamydiifrater volucris TaxID=2681470 RepID=UPI0024848BB7|nr:16S rRNA (cytosine(1402)-N(4))-methyltransferase RsmH [Chlamydiifrater volucris]
MNSTEFPHVSVMVRECLDCFSLKSPEVFCDVTVGAGGHAEAFLTEFTSIKEYKGFDRDASSLEISSQRLEKFSNRVSLCKASFSELRDHLKSNSIDGLLADLGMSSMQLDDPHRGFSFRWDAPLDMRMDISRGETASDVLNGRTEKELGDIFRLYGEEPSWKNAAKAIVAYRKRKKILTVNDLKEATVKVFPSYRLRKKIHPLTLLFQALRVYVNNEWEQLNSLLSLSTDVLSPGGRMVIISFCSSEDRPVKNFFREAEKKGVGFVVTKKVIMPSREEVRRNPRSRSAKLRCFEKS